MKGTEAPSRIFRSAAELIDAFYVVECDFAISINAEIAPLLLACLKTVLENTNDNAFINLDRKSLVCQFLVKGKHSLLEFLHGKEKINDSSEISILQDELLQLNPAPKVSTLPLAQVDPAKRLLSDCKQISDAASLSHCRETHTRPSAMTVLLAATSPAKKNRYL